MYIFFVDLGVVENLEPLCLLRTKSQQHQQRELFRCLAYVERMLDDTEAGKPWHLVKTNKQFISLKPLVESVICSSCTSAPVECIFSHGGLFIRPHRARMSDQLLCDLMLAKCNSK